MNVLRVLLIDDESLARRGLKMRLSQFNDVEIVGECQNGREAIATISETNPDLIFLDIQMPGIDGFGVIEHLQSDAMPLVIFVTAFDHYAIEAFKIHAVDYVLKPADDKRLREALDRAHARKALEDESGEKSRLIDLIVQITGQSQHVIDRVIASGDTSLISRYPEKIAIKDAGKTTLVAVNDIDWIDAAGDYMCLHANGMTHVMRTTMKDLEDQLDPTGFQRIHRSTIVNISRVESVINHISGEYFLLLKNGMRLKMSRGYKNKIKYLIGG